MSSSQLRQPSVIHMVPPQVNSPVKRTMRQPVQQPVRQLVKQLGRQSVELKQLGRQSVEPQAGIPTHASQTETPLTELSNSELVLRCQTIKRRDREAFEELVSRYGRYVEKLLYHLASDWSDRTDLAQEVWIRVYKSIHRLHEPAKFKSWLGRITTNLFYDELRKRKRFKGSVSLDAPRYSSDGQYDWELPSDQPTPADNMMTREFHDHLKQAMSELPEVFQKTIAMRELQGLSYEEIASITGVSLGTVKSRIARARQRLQEKLSVYLDGENNLKEMQSVKRSNHSRQEIYR